MAFLSLSHTHKHCTRVLPWTNRSFHTNILTTFFLSQILHSTNSTNPITNFIKKFINILIYSALNYHHSLEKAPSNIQVKGHSHLQNLSGSEYLQEHFEIFHKKTHDELNSFPVIYFDVWILIGGTWAIDFLLHLSFRKKVMAENTAPEMSNPPVRSNSGNAFVNTEIHVSH